MFLSLCHGQYRAIQVFHVEKINTAHISSYIWFRSPPYGSICETLFCRFYDTWNFPNCLGAIDGKLVHIRAPDNTGTVYFNYKKTFSINLMAVASGDYKFISVDIGQIGSASDSGIWERSQFGEAWKQKALNTPPPTPLPGTIDPVDYVMICDAPTISRTGHQYHDKKEVQLPSLASKTCSWKYIWNINKSISCPIHYHWCRCCKGHVYSSCLLCSPQYAPHCTWQCLSTSRVCWQCVKWWECCRWILASQPSKLGRYGCHS